MISDKPQNNALITNPLCYSENHRFLKTPIIILANLDAGQGTHCSKHCPLYSVFFVIDNAIRSPVLTALDDVQNCACIVCASITSEQHLVSVSRVCGLVPRLPASGVGSLVLLSLDLAYFFSPHLHNVSVHVPE